MAENIEQIEIVNSISVSSITGEYFTSLLKDEADNVNVVDDYSSFPLMTPMAKRFVYSASQDNTIINRLTCVMKYNENPVAPGPPGLQAENWGIIHSDKSPGILIYKKINDITSYINPDNTLSSNIDWYEYNNLQESPLLIAAPDWDFFSFEINFGESGIKLNNDDEFGIEVQADFTEQAGPFNVTILEEQRFRVQGIKPTT